MPAIYEYFGLLFLFYSNEHEPVHVHVRSGEYENAYELMINDGKLVALKKRKIKGKKELLNKKSKQAEKLISKYSEEILKKWFNYFILKKEIDFEKINDKL